MPQIIEVPGFGEVEFPDGMTDAQIVSAIKRNTAPRPAVNQAAMNPEVDTPFGTIKGETSTGFNPAAAIIKAGRGITSLARGVEQAKFGPADWLKEKLGMKPSGISAQLAQAEASDTKPMQDLQAVHPGSAMIGDLALAAGVPWRALPAIAASEYGSPLERAKGAGLTAAGGALVQKGGQIASRLFADSKASAVSAQANNAFKDQGVAESQAIGYKGVPSVTNGPLLGRIVEGTTGKVKAKQLAAVQNQALTDSLVRKAFALPEDAPIARETMQAIRADAAAKGYDPVRQLPRMETDDAFRAEARALTSRADNASQDFGDLVKSDIKPLADGLSNVKSFTGSTAVDQVAIFREAASELYASGNKTLGKAYRQAAEAIEAQIDRALTRSGKDGVAILQNYRAARTRMAQTFDVEKALREGQGHVDALALGKLYAKNPKRMSGELAQIGRAASTMPEVMAVPKDGWANPFTAVDSMGSSAASILAGNPLPMAIPAARVMGRYGLISGPGQKILTRPKYKPSATLGAASGLLDNRLAPYLGGLLAYESANR